MFQITEQSLNMGFFLFSVRVDGRDHVYACWHGILRYGGSVNSFRTVHSIHRSCLQASTETVA